MQLDRRAAIDSATTAPLEGRLRIGMAVYGDLTHDSRVRREAETLAKSGHRVVLACLPGTGPNGWSPAGVYVLPLLPGRGGPLPGTSGPFGSGQRPRRWLAPVDRVAWLIGYLRNLRSWGDQVVAAIGDADVWHVHDLPALVAISAHVRTDSPIVYDSHELFLDTGIAGRLPAALRSLVRLEEQKRVRRVDTLITVNQELAAVLDRRYHPRRTVVVHNCPARTAPYDGPDLLRLATGIPPSAPIVLHHGLLAGHRGLEVLTEAVLEPGLESVHLVLLGYGGLRESLSALSRTPRFAGRVHVLDAVPVGEVLNWISSASVGAIALPGTDMNLRLATPNKLFECLAAGIPVVVSDLPAVRRIVDDPAGALGTICDPTRPASVALAIRSILELNAAERLVLRNRCFAAARDRWNWETEVQGLIETYERIAAERPHPAA
jgi:glycosyltransferase involved in cell wall biosynthesis